MGAKHFPQSFKILGKTICCAITFSCHGLNKLDSVHQFAQCWTSQTTSRQLNTFSLFWAYYLGKLLTFNSTSYYSECVFLRLKATLNGKVLWSCRSSWRQWCYHVTIIMQAKVKSDFIFTHYYNKIILITVLARI